MAIVLQKAASRKLAKTKAPLARRLTSPLLGLLCLALCAPQMVPAKTSDTASPTKIQEELQVRTIHCPTRSSVGAIALTSETAINGLHDIQGSILHQATGTFTVKVPKHSVIALIVNAYGSHNSAELAGIKGIDALKMQVMDFESDDSDSKGAAKETLSDKALKNICQINSLRYLDLDRSDITDTGLKHITALKNLEQLAIFSTDVTGPGLAVLPQIPKLSVLDAGACRLVMNDLRYLPMCKNLSILRIDGVALNKEGARHIAQCQNLIELAVPHSNQVDDSVIAPLVQLKKLKRLDLRQSRVTAKGLCQLSSLKLERLELPGSGTYTKSELAALRRAFPKTEIVDPGAPVVDKDINQIFAPVSRQRKL